ncbi:PREDICTED: anaphase-promoting complex subunit 4-like isoform X2 [Amphimedon queenslandica]|uniref:Anaphase-promoting complex subunit 4 n=1 Tax=Amphimedon queenslandica TaxID=400682 RepID=A0A1X7VRZ6_AMPQE|nr:PREDICTED: anaphase-promoting complex subunit 4-like isoform X2 [Amphimedon queenslandica]|eukprot:XP_019855536.1 PREDICTED: anaphase-promoting complex subunit 4-like isoform X2 [Amphimedon queenslandica]
MEEEEQDLSYKLRGEKSLPSAILLSKWSPRMDVIALALEDGSVVLQRLSWDSVWSVDPGDTPVNALSWRPDGKVLAIGYSDGVLIEVSIEKGEMLQKLKLGSSKITVLTWIEAPPPATMPPSSSVLLNKSNTSYKDNSVRFLPPLPLIENDEMSDDEEDNVTHKESVPSSKYISHLSSMTLLLAGDECGHIHIVIDGVLHITSLSLLSEGMTVSSIISLKMSHNFCTLAAVSCNENNTLFYNLVDTSLLANKVNELHFVAVKYNHVLSVMAYVGDVIRAMTDAWEDGLLTVDKKMERYAKTLPSCLQLMDEYIILLACGQARAELKSFLVDELTAKGVKKIGLSIEMSYKSLRRYTINHLNKAIEALNFHLHDLFGVSGWDNVFGCIGLSTETLQGCMQVLGSFALKAQEFLYVTDESLQNLKIFFIWLYTIIIKLAGEPAPTPPIEEGPTPEELQMIIDFLRKRLKPVHSEGHGQAFSLDLVGQYLLSKNLSVVEEPSQTIWDKILSDTASLTREVAPWLIKSQTNKSIMQLYQSLQSSVNKAFNSTKEAMQSLFVQKTSLKLFDYNSNLSSRMKSLVTLYSNDTGSSSCLFPINEHQIATLEHDQDSEVKYGSFFVQCTSENEEERTEKYHIYDMSVYNGDTLSLLLYNGASYMVAQLPMAAVSTVTLNLIGCEVLQDSIQMLSGVDIGRELAQGTSLGRFQAKSLEVSGSRKLAAVVSIGGRRVQLFDVDAEQDDEDI